MSGPAGEGGTLQESAVVPQEVQLIVDALDDRRAKDIVVLDLAEVSATLDYFIVATGESHLQLRALEDAVRDGITATRRYAKRQQTWFRNQTPDALFGNADACFDAISKML